MANTNKDNVASLNPDDMLSGGLKDDFRGTITAAAYVRWDYDGTIDTPVLGARLTIQPAGDENDDDNKPLVQHWSAGSLESFVPSKDGEEPCEEDEVGPYALRVGKRAQLNNNTNFAFLLTSILDAGKASKKFDRTDLTPSLECLVGLDAHWNRVPQKKRSGLVQAEGKDQGGRQRPSDVLVVTEVFGYSPGAKKGKASKDRDEGAQAAPEASDLDARIQAVLLEALSDNGNKLKKSKIAPEVLRRMAKDKDKAKAIKRSTETDFLKDGPWNYDAEAGVISL